ncbi:hypothetical protein BJ170DRAFT_590150 [Xylariales sp. AK1849]|nr:hypothetical protein BJ170DRAFT_590150 [Xylariales sp. AK1849]
MYSSYGSYSSMGSLTQPMDIAPRSYLSGSSAYHANCAFPSWPQRSSLGSPMREEREERATSYLSDDDLLDWEDDAHSISSASSNASGPRLVTEQELLEMQREKADLQREALKFLVQERERRKQVSKHQRRGSNGSTKKSPKSKNDAMTSIYEAVE